MSDINPHQYLHDNLLILNELIPGGPEFLQCFKENMFLKPNRAACDHVLFYLCSAYDSGRYLSKIPWPILDRSQERLFRQNTVVFVKAIIQEVPEARLPQFSPSFIANPGGDRFATFMWKFSLLVLKTVIERESDYPVLQYPTTGLHLMEHITKTTLEKVEKDIDDLCCLLIDSCHYGEKLSNMSVSQRKEIETMKLELKNEVHNLKHCPLSEQEKSVIIDGDMEQFHVLAKKWQHYLNAEASKAKAMLKDLRDCSHVVTECHESVKLLLDQKITPVVLDATNYPSTVKDKNGNLDLTHIFSEGANSISAISKTLSICGGNQSLCQALPELKQINKQYQEVEESLDQTKAGYIKTISELVEDVGSSKSGDESMDLPMTGGLQLGHKLLQSAQMSTPPLQFNIQDVSSSHHFSTESPPVEEFVGRKRLPRHAKPSIETDTVHAPKTSQSLSAFTPKKTQSGMVGSSSKTLANFYSGHFSTSTALKPVPAVAANRNLSCASLCKESSQSIVKKLTDSPLKEDTQTSMKFQTSVVTFKEEFKKALSEEDKDVRKNEEKSESSRIECETGETKITEKASSSFIHKASHSVDEANETGSSEQVEFSTPTGKSALQDENLTSNSNRTYGALPKIHIISDLDSTFDSPQSSAMEMFSPSSANNSFFLNDDIMNKPISNVPQSEFDDDISPSGRISLCPLSENVDPPKEETAPSDASKKSRRQSLQLIIDRYHDFMASSTACQPIQLSEPSSPSDQSSNELDFEVEEDLKFE